MLGVARILYFFRRLFSWFVFRVQDDEAGNRSGLCHRCCDNNHKAGGKEFDRGKSEDPVWLPGGKSRVEILRPDGKIDRQRIIFKRQIYKLRFFQAWDIVRIWL